ncbi:uncharacterized protein LOC105830232 isoform X2 [Monomorium pharaonis]|uniref:uncharacterized protein LOC105830232 isoform X2 n=1 Tax=Monomorium pharaonis TaxID=307658 RepID=UPI001747881E|nr:uncharacterized protein LOC105830232 isoform X2 [Monomorium pharaonis]
MISKFIFVWCLSYLCSKAHTEHSSQYFQESSDNTQCIFDVPRKIYNVTDLLRCMDELAIDLLAQNSDRSLIVGRTSQLDSSIYKENYGFPYGNIILNLLNNGQVPSEYHDFPLDSIGNYPLNMLNGLSSQFGGLGANIFSALSSISRHDDLKCVPRILCEVASGKPPRQYERASAGIDKQYLEFGRNTFTQWLAGLAETSPILNFARAAVLGYGSNGNSAMCYRAFPRCPRNPDKLVHYLNNYNGGFFRFFRGHGSYSQSSYALRDNSEFHGERKRKAPPPGIAGVQADRTGTGKLKFDSPILTARQDYGKSFFPRENTLENSGRVVFPDQEESSDRLLKNRISKSLSDLKESDVNTFSQESSLIFPQESEHQSIRVLRFTPDPLDSASHSAVRFPR